MRQLIKLLTIGLTFLLSSISYSHGAVPVMLDKLEDYLIGGQYIEVLEDKSHSFSFSDILNGRQAFKSVEGNYFATMNTESIYWIRFKVEALPKERRKWVLEILDSRQDTVVLYEPNGDHNYTAAIAGIEGGFSNRQYKHKNFVFELSLNNPGGKYYYLKFKSSPVTSLLFKIRTTQDFTEYGLNEYYLLGLYYGILAMMAFYSLFVYLTTREKVYLFYILYILSWMYYSMIRDGTGFQYIWPGVNFISTMGFYISKPLLLGAFVMYCLEFLTFSSYPKLRNITIGLLVFYFVYYLAETLLDFSFLDNLFFLVPFLIIFYISLMNYRAGYKPARYFLIGNSIVVFCIIVANLRDSGLLEMIVHIDLVAIIAVYSTNIGMVLEIMVLSFALADRVKFLKIEREKTQQELIHQLHENQRLSEKVNRELEEKVTERTQVIEEKSQLLKEANLKLIHQSEKINQMNALLDIDNWNLKKSLIEEKESRIKLKDISFEEFMQV
ncbi:MAG TPA: 7TM diverse intracellular signaling domain-containing protein, partial [Cytophagaceae bacterium]|nr:7TM diverse intracellular signaling domain-containing protein [Cytophagaceae bacterium]